MHRICAITVLLACCGACRVGPDFCGPPVARLTEDWREIPDASIQVESRDLAGWWMGFEDPVLNSVIEVALAENLDLREAAARIMEARALRCTVRADLFPQFSQDASFTHSKRAQSGGPFAGIGLPGGFSNVLDLWGIGLTGNWEVDLFGRLRRLVEAADADIQFSEEDYRDTLVVLLADVATMYVEARTFQQRLDYARQNLNLQEQTLELTRQRVQGEIAFELDMAQARINVETTASEIPNLETGYRQSLNRLSVLLGAPPGAVDAMLTRPQPVPTPPAEIAIGIPADLLRRRPDIRAAESQLAAQTARIGAAVGEIYPKFSITGSFGIDAQQFSQLFDRDAISASIGPQMQWNIFNYGKLRCNVLVQEARQDQRAIQYQRLVLQAAEEVDNFLVAYANEKRRLSRLVQAVEASQRATELSRQRYVLGKENFQRVLDSQRSLVSSQDQLVVSRSNVAANLIGLYRALGGGWQLPTMMATEPSMEDLPPTVMDEARPEEMDSSLPMPM
jgi:multidrug efflux system outer membrane protein